MSRVKAKTAALLASPEDVEGQFYEALREADLDKLMAAWAEDEEIVCVHPGGQRQVGVQAVREAFAAVFGNGPVPVEAQSVRRIHSLSCAVHSVLERIAPPGADPARVGWVLATNVYLKTTLGWRLVAHHASPGSAGETPEPGEAPAVLH